MLLDYHDDCTISDYLEKKKLWYIQLTVDSMDLTLQESITVQCTWKLGGSLENVMKKVWKFDFTI